MLAATLTLDEDGPLAQRTFTIDHDVATVFAKLTDPEFIVARSHAMGELDASCDVEQSGGRTLLHISRTVSKDPASVPKVMRRFGLRQTVSMEEEWWDEGEGKAGRFVAHPGNLPVRLEAELKITPLAAGSEYAVTQHCRVNIPLIGTHLEPLMLAQRQKDLDEEVTYLLAALG